MLILTKLILSHLIGDFVLQPQSWVKEKEIKKAKSIKLYLHSLIHGILVFILLWNVKFWGLALLISLIHLGIDLVKLYFQKEESKTKWFIIDQILHIISILFLWILFYQPDLKTLLNSLPDSIWVLGTALLFITSVSGIMIQIMLKKWSSAIDIENDESLNNAGKYIGILERLFIFLFVIMGKWEGIGFMLAAKSIFRFGDLKESKDRKLTEYILIGTLLSFAVAIATGLLVLKII